MDDAGRAASASSLPETPNRPKGEAIGAGRAANRREPELGDDREVRVAQCQIGCQGREMNRARAVTDAVGVVGQEAVRRIIDDAVGRGRERSACAERRGNERAGTRLPP